MEVNFNNSSNSRALLLGLHPFSLSTTCYHYNKTSCNLQELNSASQDTELVCNDSTYIVVKVDATPTKNYGKLTKVLLKFKQLMAVGERFCAFEANSNGWYTSLANYTGYIGTTTENGETFWNVDVTNQVLGCNSSFYIAIDRSNEIGNTDHLRLALPTVAVESTADNDLTEQTSFVSNTVGHKVQYNAKLLNGKLYCAHSLYSASGNIAPFNLAMCYNASQATSPSLSFARGWRFNYDQTLDQQNNGFSYVDGANKDHKFVASTNNSTKYCDTNGKSGLLLYQSGNDYVITDEKTTTLHFNANKQLYKIQQKIGNNGTANVYATVLIARDSLGRITSVTDGSGTEYVLDYTTENAVTLKQGQTNLVSIVFNSTTNTLVATNLRSGESYTYTYNAQEQLLASIKDNATCQLVEFGYNAHGGVASICNYVQQTTTKNATECYFVTYGYSSATVGATRNTSDPTKCYSKTLYQFAADGNTQSVVELDSAGNAKNTPTFKHKDAYTQWLQSPNVDVLHNFKFTIPAGSDQTTEQVEFPYDDFYTGDIKSDTFELDNVDLASDYLLTVQCKVEPQKPFGVDDYVYVGVCKLVSINGREQEVRFIEELLDVHSEDLQTRVYKLPVLDGYNKYKVVLVAAGCKRYNATFKNIKIVKQNATETKQATNVNVGTAPIEQQTPIGTRTWYAMQNPSITCNGISVQDVQFTTKDYALTLASRWQNPTNFTLWYNNGASCFCNASTATFTFQNGTTVALNDLQLADVSVKGEYKTFAYSVVENGFLRTYQNATLLQTYKQAYTVVDSCFRTTRQVDYDGIETEYTYDTFGNLLKQRQSAPTGGTLNILHSNSYTADGNQIASQTWYKGLQSCTTALGFDAEGLLVSEIQPNGQQYNYTYSPEKEKLTGISTQLEGESLPCQNGIEYQNALVKNLTDTNNTYYFVYDNRNNIAEFRMNGQILLRKSIYYAADGTTSTTTNWANGATFVKTYDKYNRLIKVMLGENSSPSTIVAYIYSDNEVDDTVTDPQHSSLAISATSKLRKVVDYTTNPTTVQTYVYNNLGEVESVQSGALTQTVEQKDFANRPTRVSRKFNNVQCMVNTYTYRDIVSNALQSEKVEYYLNSSVQTDYTYDGLGRTQQTALHSNISHAGVTTKYTYVPRQEKQQSPIGDSGVGITPIQPFVTVTVGTTPLVGNVKRYLTVGSTETLLATEDVEYDSCGNITKYGDTTFVYDKLNRLVRENNKTIDKTIVWEYDVSGNVTSRREYAYTEGTVGTQTGSCSFGYNHATHKDWLTSFVGIPITYDAMGNPTSYKGTTFGWSRGRLLTSATQGSKSISMGYNIDGVRCNKTVITGSGVVSTTYHYEGANLMHEVVTKNGTTTNRKYLYNSQGIVGFIQDDVEYIYHKNIFGDIVAIYQGATKVAEYAYDAYGRNFINVDIDGIATSNPFRYRGYYWDSDLSLYYLMSRYYDPATSRFINTDSLEYLDPESIHGLNLFAYCGNNPVMNVDPEGHVALSIILIAAAIGFAVSFGTSIVDQLITMQEVNWGMALVDGLFGAIDGALATLGLGWGVSLLIDTALNFSNALIVELIESKGHLSREDWSAIMISTALSTLVSASSSLCEIGFDNKHVDKLLKEFDEVDAIIKKGSYRSFNDEVSTKARRKLLKKKIFTNRSVVAMYAIGSLTATASTCGCKALGLAA